PQPIFRTRCRLADELDTPRAGEARKIAGLMFWISTTPACASGLAATGVAVGGGAGCRSCWQRCSTDRQTAPSNHEAFFAAIAKRSPPFVQTSCARLMENAPATACPRALPVETREWHNGCIGPDLSAAPTLVEGRAGELASRLLRHG